MIELCKFKLYPCNKEATVTCDKLPMCAMHASYYKPENAWRLTVLELGNRIKGINPETDYAEKSDDSEAELPKTLFEYEKKTGKRFKRTNQEMKDGLTREQAFQARVFWEKKK